MARRFKVRFRKKPNVTMVITGVVTLAITLLVGNNILTSVGTTIGNHSGTPFESALTFLGMSTTTAGAWSSTGIVGILGLAAVASFVLAFVKISMR